MEYYKKEETGTVVNRKQSGHQKITSATEDKRIGTTSKRNRLLTVPEITNSMNGLQEDQISVTTVKRQLTEAGLGGRLAARKPLLWPQKKKRRLQWAKHKQ